MKKRIEISAGYPVVFTTGAFIAPVKRTINGKEVWQWIVTGFEEDSYFEGETCDPQEYVIVEMATDKNKLLQFYDEDE